MEDISSYGLNPRNNAVVVSENNVFENVNKPYNVSGDAQLVVRGDLLINSPNGSAPRGRAFTPEDYYSYTLDDAADVRDLIRANSGPQAWVGIYPLEGDYNQDGVVDAADFTVWRDHEGDAAGALPNDPHTGGLIGSAQYDTWVANFGRTSPSLAFALPEPTTTVSLLLASLAVLVRPPRRLGICTLNRRRRESVR